VRSRGQASVEYVALVALVGLALAGAAALTAGGLGPRIVYAIRLGLCTLTHTACPAPPRDRADLPPCPVGRRTRSQDLDLSVAFVRLGQGLGLEQDSYSDGHVVVRFVDEHQVGLTGTLGVAFKLGRVTGAGVGGDLSVTFQAGRAWSFSDPAAARRFVREYGSLQTLVGRAIDDLERDCWVCRQLGFGPKTPPPPTETYAVLGGRAHADATAGLDQASGLDEAASAAIGRRDERGGRRTVYFRLAGAAALDLAAGAGLSHVAEASGAVALTLDRHGRPLGLRLEGAALTADGWGGSGGGRVEEVETDIPLDSAAARSRMAAVLHALAPARLRELPAAVARAERWARSHATTTRRTYALAERHGGAGVELRAGVDVGGGYAHTSRELRLVGVQTRLPGLPFLSREDCLRGTAAIG
jgi:hypothetical protein